MNLIGSLPKSPFTSPAIQQPNYKPNHKQRHEAINEYVDCIDNQGEEDDTFNVQTSTS